MLFETVELVEYESRRIRTAAPSPDDLALAERLAPRGDLDARITVRWLAGGLVDIAASSWIGVIRFTNLEIRVIPKLVGDPLRVLRMLEYSGGVRLLAQLPIERELPAHGSDLFELIVMLLVQETQTLMRDGLIRDYRSVDDALVIMRGRLRIREQFLQRYGSFHRLECQFDEYDGDIPENQLLAAALSAASRRVRDPELKSETHVLAHMLAGVCEPSARDTAWYRRRIQVWAPQRSISVCPCARNTGVGRIGPHRSVQPVFWVGLSIHAEYECRIRTICLTPSCRFIDRQRTTGVDTGIIWLGGYR
ncbi:hypothetical protein H7K31_25375 [Mycolicibacterium bacteremicum]|nr:hypothetical protein [Mycolicibacterium bacteremicum]